MQRDLGDRLIDSTQADLDSEAEMGTCEQFFYETLLAVYGLLPGIAQEQLSHRGPALPSEDDLAALDIDGSLKGCLDVGFVSPVGAQAYSLGFQPQEAGQPNH